MNLPLDAIKTFIGGLVIENLALQHRVAELETMQPLPLAQAATDRDEIAGRKRPALKDMTNNSA